MEQSIKALLEAYFEDRGENVSPEVVNAMTAVVLQG
jgi:hypothetical protein